MAYEVLSLIYCKLVYHLACLHWSTIQMVCWYVFSKCMIWKYAEIESQTHTTIMIQVCIIGTTKTQLNWVVSGQK